MIRAHRGEPDMAAIGSSPEGQLVLSGTGAVLASVKDLPSKNTLCKYKSELGT